MAEAQPQTVLDVLISARAMIKQPENWAQDVAARKTGLPTCASFALNQVSRDNRGEYNALWSDARARLLDAAGCGSVVYFNDHNTHNDVIAAFDRAIESERAKASAA